MTLPSGSGAVPRLHARARRIAVLPSQLNPSPAPVASATDPRGAAPCTFVRKLFRLGVRQFGVTRLVRGTRRSSPTLVTLKACWFHSIREDTQRSATSLYTRIPRTPTGRDALQVFPVPGVPAGGAAHRY